MTGKIECTCPECGQEFEVELEKRIKAYTMVIRKGGRHRPKECEMELIHGKKHTVHCFNDSIGKVTITMVNGDVWTYEFCMEHHTLAEKSIRKKTLKGILELPEKIKKTKIEYYREVI